MQNEQTPANVQAPGSAAIPCRDLRCKEMFYEAPGTPEDEFASGIYWCVRTQENSGPDGQPCSKCECGPERACYRI